ncbi:AraC family transcriptional regulator [Sphingobacterium sp.]|uniref:AraC family transcriptional regulator n=1 Tax=Sphingobacterium sp. TaxID=341027 RepID=UPI0028A8966D|nr:AraC family transcriptional regulator [Sphingobacterium sp.]
MKPELIIDAPIIGQKKIWIKKVKTAHFNHPFHFHDLWELVWIEKGYGKLIIGDYVGSFEKNELILKAPKLPHLWKCDPDFYKTDNNLITKATSIYFPIDLITQIIDDSEYIKLIEDLTLKAQRGLKFTGNTKELIISLVINTSKKKGLTQTGNFLKIMDLLLKSKEYIPLASINYQKTMDENDIQRFNDVYQYILNNSQKIITLNEVSEICHMTPNSFCRFFKRKTQKTFIQFLNEIRIGQACKLLNDENLSLKEICYEIGFNNPVSFFTIFKKIKGMTPNDYRDSFKLKTT